MCKKYMLPDKIAFRTSLPTIIYCQQAENVNIFSLQTSITHCMLITVQLTAEITKQQMTIPHYQSMHVLKNIVLPTFNKLQGNTPPEFQCNYLYHKHHVSGKVHGGINLCCTYTCTTYSDLPQKLYRCKCSCKQAAQFISETEIKDILTFISYFKGTSALWMQFHAYTVVPL